MTVFRGNSVIDMKILIVCTGNTCRSPFAMAYFNSQFAKLGLPFEADSAGLFTVGGEKPCSAAVSASEKFGLSTAMAEYRSKMISAKDIVDADIIFAVTQNHYEMLKPQVELANSRRTDGRACELYCLGTDIPDPYGGDVNEYLSCYETIAACADNVISELKSRHDNNR